jgi:hypothetical protein
MYREIGEELREVVVRKICVKHNLFYYSSQFHFYFSRGSQHWDPTKTYHDEVGKELESIFAVLKTKAGDKMIGNYVSSYVG